MEDMGRLLELREICYNNINNINRIISQCTFSEKRLRYIKRNYTSDEQEKFIEDKRKLVEYRIEKLKTMTWDINIPQIKQKQKQTEVYLDERSITTQWEKALALLAVSLGYAQTEIARLLGISAQHMALNIVPEWKQKHILQILDWFKRCPACGVYLHDLFEGAIKSRTKGCPPNLTDIDMEHIQLSSYQKENISLKKEIRELKRKLNDRK